MIVFDEADARFMTPGGHEVEFRYRKGTNDWNTIWSCLNEDEYGLRGLSLSGVAFDIGAHVGSVAVALALDHPDLHVVAVEPVEDNRRLIELNARQNHARVTIVPAAAGGPDETVTRLHVNFRGTEHAWHHGFIGTTENGNEAVAENWRLGSDHDILEVPTVSASSLAAEYGTPSIVKLDCEGAEYAFFRDRTVDDWPLLVGEWHNVPHGGRLRSDRADFAALLPRHRIEFSGAVEGPGGFRAVL